MECKEVWSEFWQFPRSNYFLIRNYNEIEKFPVNKYLFLDRQLKQRSSSKLCVFERETKIVFL